MSGTRKDVRLVVAREVLHWEEEITGKYECELSYTFIPKVGGPVAPNSGVRVVATFANRGVLEAFQVSAQELIPSTKGTDVLAVYIRLLSRLADELAYHRQAKFWERRHEGN